MSSKHSAGAELFAGRGEMADLLRSFPWESTSLGPAETWPQSLKTAIRIMMTSRQPIWIGWGQDLIYFYNDPYKSVIGGRHPWALRKPVKEVWGEIWAEIGPMLATAMSGTEGTYVEEQLLIMERNGYPEETYYTFSYSPIPDDNNNVGGIICANTDDTQRVISERQLALLSYLAAQIVDTKSWRSACENSMAALRSNQYDLPFAALYLKEADGMAYSLCGVSGIERDHPAAPSQLTAESSPWPLDNVVHQITLIDLLAQHFGNLPTGVWKEAPKSAAILPILPNGETGRSGFLLVGLNPFRLFDDNYQSFLGLVAGQISAAIANALAYEEERKRAEALAEIDKAKTIFFSNVSHEFRTPLTLMLGPLKHVLDNNELREDIRMDLKVVHRNGLRLLKLVNSLLDFSRVEAGRMQAVYAPEDLAVLTADLASNFRSACERTGLDLSIDCAPLPRPVYVDRDLWEKIVFNLLSNAFKFTFKGGISVVLRAKSDSAILQVSDTGVGIAQEDQAKIFERFRRVENSSGRSHEGTGIGLALVKELVKLHGGSIHLNSAAGRGTTFTVEIPFGKNHLPQDQISSERAKVSTATRAEAFVEEALRWLPDNAASTAESTNQRQRILLADDNADMRVYIQRILSDAYHVVAVGDGRAVLEEIKRQRPDLILSDVMMPKLDGFGLLKELRGKRETRDIPIILLSARAGEEARIEGLEAGADDYLVKPFSARELKARVQGILMKEEERYEQEQHFHMIADSSPAILWTTNAEGECTYLSRQWYELTGGAAPQDLGFEWFKKIHANDFEVEEFLIATAERRPFRSEFRLRQKNGEYIWVISAGSPRYDNQNRFIGFVGCVFDITDRRRMEIVMDGQRRALEMSVAGVPLTEILDVFAKTVELQSSSDVYASILLLDETGERLWHGAAPSLPESYNRSVNGIFVRPDAGSCGTAVYRRENVMVGDIERDPLWRDFKDLALSHNLRACWSMPIFSTEGKPLATFALYYANTMTSPSPGDRLAVEVLGGTAALIIDKNIDMRLRREAEQKLRESEAALREADKRKDEFLATLAHELRNPLAPISNALKIMDMSHNPSAVNEMRELINRQLVQMVRLVDDLMDVSRITCGKVELRKERLSLSRVLQNTIEVVQSMVVERQQTLRLHFPEDEIWLDADFTRLSQIFTNILNNASKYTPVGGLIEVTVETNGAEVVVSVQDNGMGIPPDKLPFIFEMFSQVADHLDRTHGGLGIGLTLVEQLLRMHGGRVEAFSDGLGKGSRFTVTLPRAQSSAPDDQVQPPIQNKSSSELRILVVDDNRESAKTLAQLIDLLGHTTKTAFDGPTAIEIAAEYRPDLILMDIGMPDMNGYEACRLLRKNPALDSTVVVAQTGWSEKRHNHMSKDAGFDLHLVKPIDLSVLQDLLADVVAKRAEGSERFLVEQVVDEVGGVPR